MVHFLGFLIKSVEVQNSNVLQLFSVCMVLLFINDLSVQYKNQEKKILAVDHVSFTLQENEVIGRNISMFRRLQSIKALDMASRMDMKLGAYSKYERGETRITIEFVKKAAEVLKIDPLKLVAVPTQNFVQTICDSPNSPSPSSVYGGGAINNSDPKQTEMVIKLIENVMQVNERILKLLEKGQ